MSECPAVMMGSIVRGMAAGVAGTVVMTAFQKLVEMPLTGREASYAPADFAERILPIHPDPDLLRLLASHQLRPGTGLRVHEFSNTAVFISINGSDDISRLPGTGADIIWITAPKRDEQY